MAQVSNLSWLGAAGSNRIKWAPWASRLSLRAAWAQITELLTCLGIDPSDGMPISVGYPGRLLEVGGEGIIQTTHPCWLNYPGSLFKLLLQSRMRERTIQSKADLGALNDPLQELCFPSLDLQREPGETSWLHLTAKLVAKRWVVRIPSLFPFAMDRTPPTAGCSLALSCKFRGLNAIGYRPAGTMTRQITTVDRYCTILCVVLHRLLLK